MKNSNIWAEMARRKKQFHPRERWDIIKLWTLHYPSEIKHLTKKGLLIRYKTGPNDKEHPRCVDWYYPSREAWEKHIEPLMSKSLKDLEILSGWRNENGEWR